MYVCMYVCMHVFRLSHYTTTFNIGEEDLELRKKARKAFEAQLMYVYMHDQYMTN